MSVKVQAGVWECGPADRTQLLIMLAIADNADDFGFGCPSHALIAQKARCDVRTVIRQLEALQQDGWLAVIRRAVNGKANAYFINLEKMGVTVSPDAFLSPLHARLRKAHGDTLSRIFLREKSGDTGNFSGDNSQPLEVTSAAAQVTFETEIGDTRCHRNSGNRKNQNRKESPKDVESDNPPTPLQGGARTRAEPYFQVLKSRIKQELKSHPHGSDDPRFRRLREHEDDYDTCFRDWWPVDARVLGGTFTLITEARDAEMTRLGLAKYRTRLEAAARQAFSVFSRTPVEFTVREAQTQTPAA